MINRTAIATLSRIEEMFHRGISYPGDLDRIEQLVLNAKSQLQFQEIDRELEIPERNIKQEVKECVN